MGSKIKAVSTVIAGLFALGISGGAQASALFDSSISATLKILNTNDPFASISSSSTPFLLQQQTIGSAVANASGSATLLPNGITLDAAANGIAFNGTAIAGSTGIGTVDISSNTFGLFVTYELDFAYTLMAGIDNPLFDSASTFVHVLLLDAGDPGNPIFDSGNISLTAFGHDDLIGPIDVQITDVYAFDPLSQGGAFLLQVDVFGTATGVPEPATLALFGLGLLGAASVRRRRNR